MSSESQRGTVIIGIDPGTSACGYGVLRVNGRRFSALDHGAWRTRSQDPLPLRLLSIIERYEVLLDHWKPRAVAVEQAFLGRNVQSTLRLGEARGALLCASARAEVEIFEYSTSTVKRCVTGNGRADKTQLRFMLERLLRMPKGPSSLDASDALGLAFTLANELGQPRALRGRG